MDTDNRSTDMDSEDETSDYSEDDHERPVAIAGLYQYPFSFETRRDAWDSDGSSSESEMESYGESGFRVEFSNNEESDSAQENNQQGEAQENIFNLELTTLHTYLGQDLEELRGRMIFDDGIYAILPLLIKEFVVLFPGQTLPMMEYNSQTIDMLKNCIQNNRTFGVVCMSDTGFVPIGTTAEIYEYKQRLPMEALCLKAKGRQRFKILQVISQGHDKISAKVKILPEVLLERPLFEERLASLNHCRESGTTEEDLKRRERIENMDAMASAWPGWVHRQFDALRLSQRIRERLQFLKIKKCVIPTDPTKLSFWVAQNLLLDNKEKTEILNYDCAVLRLQRELKYLANDTLYVCRECDTCIGMQSDIFAMSKDGLQAAYCNPGGALYEVITLHRAGSLNLHSIQGSTHCSWFPGYAWVTAYCLSCRTHMGWKFVAVNSKLKPQAFWGLLRRSLKTQSKSVKVTPEISGTTFSDSEI